MTSTDEARLWIARNREAVMVAAKTGRIRFITNRYRAGDGDEEAGARFIGFVRGAKAEKINKVPVLLYCGPSSYSRVSGLHSPKTMAFVSCDPNVALRYCSFDKLPAK